MMLMLAGVIHLQFPQFSASTGSITPPVSTVALCLLPQHCPTNGQGRAEPHSMAISAQSLLSYIQLFPRLLTEALGHC